MAHDTIGPFVGTGKDWTETFTGKRFCISDPQPEQIDIADIAQGLSNCCRYHGQCAFYSVAEHVCHVHDVLVNYGPEAQFAGLMHDAHEAYHGDVARPFKARMGQYNMDALRLQRVIENVFGVQLDEEMHAVLKLADDAVLRKEASVLMASGGRTWNWMRDGQEIPVAACTINCWTPEVARVEFLSRFYDLRTL